MAILGPETGCTKVLAAFGMCICPEVLQVVGPAEDPTEEARRGADPVLCCYATGCFVAFDTSCRLCELTLRPPTDRDLDGAGLLCQLAIDRLTEVSLLSLSRTPLRAHRASHQIHERQVSTPSKVHYLACAFAHSQRGKEALRACSHRQESGNSMKSAEA